PPTSRISTSTTANARPCARVIRAATGDLRIDGLLEERRDELLQPACKGPRRDRPPIVRAHWPDANSRIRQKQLVGGPQILGAQYILLYRDAGVRRFTQDYVPHHARNAAQIDTGR